MAHSNSGLVRSTPSFRLDSSRQQPALPDLILPGEPAEARISAKSYENEPSPLRSDNLELHSRIILPEVAVVEDTAIIGPSVDSSHGDLTPTVLPEENALDSNLPPILPRPVHNSGTPRPREMIDIPAAQEVTHNFDDQSGGSASRGEHLRMDMTEPYTPDVFKTFDSNKGTGNTANVASNAPRLDLIRWSEVLDAGLKHAERKKQRSRYRDRSLGCMEPRHPIRHWLLKICKSPFFDKFILLCIIANCIFLAMTDPICVINLNSPEENILVTTYPNHSCAGYETISLLLDRSEVVLTTIFTAEMFIKIGALGLFMHHRAYLRDGWNWIDMIVVILGLIGLDPSLGNFSGIRVVRVLRPLRTMNRIKGMRAVVMALLHSLLSLVNVLFVCFFVFFLFGILGVDIFSGYARGRCFGVGGSGEPVLLGAGQVCSVYTGGGDKCESLFPVEQYGVSTCYWNSSSDGTYNPNPTDYISCDSIVEAFLMIFQVITMEGWTDIMYTYESGHDLYGARLYFIFLVCIGAFYAVNLALAVITHKFTSSSKEEKKRQEASSTHRDKPNKSEPPSINTDKLWYLQLRLRAEGFLENVANKLKVPIDASSPFGAFRLKVRTVIESDAVTSLITCAIIANALVLALDYHHQDLYESRICELASGGQATGPMFGKVNLTSTAAPVLLGCVWDSGHALAGQEWNASAAFWATVDFDALCQNSNCFGIPSTYSSNLEKANLALTLIFCLDLTLKILGSGVWIYFQSSANFFDAFIVVASIIELSMTQGGGSTLSALRAFRLFRVFKLARRWTGLRIILQTLQNAASSIGPLSVILAIFMYMGALMGMQFFGSQFRSPIDRLHDPYTYAPDVVYSVPRSNFDTFLPSDAGFGAFVTVFQIISGENWNNVLSDGMEYTGWWSALYFIFVIVVGNYIIMNLFLAILLHSFWVVHEKQEPQNSITATVGGGVYNQMLSTIFFKQDKNKIFPAEQGDVMNTCDGLSPVPEDSVSGSCNDDAVRSMSRDEPQGDSRRNSTGDAAGVGLNGTELPPIVTRKKISPEEAFTVSNSNSSTQPAANEESSPISPATELDPDVKVMTTKTRPSIIRVKSEDLASGENTTSQNNISSGAVLTKKVSSHSSTFHDPERKLRGIFRVIDQAHHSSFFQQLMHRNCSLSLLGPDGGVKFLHPIRNFCFRIVDESAWGNWFSRFNMLAILVSTVMLIMQHPREQIDCDVSLGTASICDWIRVYNVIDVVLLVIFTVELVLKVVAYGALLHETAYFRDPWNVLDAGIVAISFASVLSKGSNLKALRTIRAFRTLRPLRVLKRNQGMKMSVMCILKSIPAAFNVGVVTVLFFGIFGVLGVQFFKGTFFRCYSGADADRVLLNYFPGNLSRPVTNLIECGVAGGYWEGSVANFDSISVSFLTVFELACTDGWLDVLSDSMDAVGVGANARLNHNPILPAIYICLVMLFSGFVMSLFVGIVIDNYNRTKAELEGALVLTSAQREWVAAQTIALRSKPSIPLRAPDFFLSQWVMKHIVQRKWFEAIVTGAIVTNTAVLACNALYLSEAWTNALYWVNVGFTVFFFLEGVVKMTGLGFSMYVEFRWNVFDLVVVFVTVAGLVVDRLTAGVYNVPGLTVFRAFRIARLFRLIKRMKQLKQLIGALTHSLPSLVNVGSLLLLFFIIYGTLTVSFFWNVNRSQNERGYMGTHAHFGDFGSAMAMLFRMITGEAWNGVMHDCMQGVCEDPAITDGCGDPVTAVVVFMSFKILGAFMMLNLFVAFILDSFEHAVQENHKVIPRDDLLLFPKVWQKFDLQATQVLPVKLLPDFLRALPPPLGLKGKRVNKAGLVQFISILRIPSHNANVHYLEVYHAVLMRVLQVQMPVGHKLAGKISREMNARLTKSFGANYETDGTDAGQEHAAGILQRLVKNKQRMHVAKLAEESATQHHNIVRV